MLWLMILLSWGVWGDLYVVWCGVVWCGVFVVWYVWCVFCMKCGLYVVCRSFFAVVLDVVLTVNSS